MPRFQDGNFERNLALLPEYERIARDAGHSMAEITLAWVLAQGDHIVPIPGTTSLAHLKENFGAADITLDDDILKRMDALVNQQTVAGPRYTAKTQREIDTETFPGEYD
jgi:aryl-alcohol dehydrogenase-like predicted oxidoreductase